MLRNFLTLVSYIGGENCLTVRARKRALSHAQQHQALYKRYEKENEYFYLSVCNDLNQRTQTFIHSGAAGNIDEIRKSHLDFSNVFDDIDFNRYHVRKPHWIPRKRKHENPYKGQHGGGAGNFKGKEGGHWKKAKFHKGDMVFNDSLNPEMKVPDPGTYHEVLRSNLISSHYIVV